MSNEKPVLGYEEPDRDVDCKPVTEQAPDRRRLIRRLVTLAGLGITGVLLSQDKTGLLPRAEATDGSALIVGTSNSSSSTTELESTVNGSAFLAYANAATGSAIGVYGVSGSSSGISVLGQAANDGTVPLVAQANSSTQTAHLQEWRGGTFGSPSVLSVVDANGNFGIGTGSPAAPLDVEG